MAAHVLRLRAALLIGALREDRRSVTRAVIGLVLLVAATVVACRAILSLDDARVDVADIVVVLGGSAITAGFAVAPVIAAVEDPLDPRRFAVFGLNPTRLAGALAAAAFVSMPTLALAAIGICTTMMWASHGVPVIVGALSALLAVATCVILTHVCMALTSLFLRERRSRELSGLFVLAIIVVVVPVGIFLSSLEWHGEVPPQLDDAITTLGYTPLGAAWAIPGAVASGAASIAWNVVIAVLTLAAVGTAWVALVRRLLSTTERPVSMRERSGLGWFAVAPGTPGGAIAARSLVYWLRDRRYLVNIVVIPIAALIAMAPPLIAGVPAPIVALIPVPIMALFFGWLPHNDLAYDSTAIWMHIASGTRGFSDRIGRLVPVVLIAVPLLAILIPVTVAQYGRWAILPAMTGVAVCLFLVGLGLSSIASVVMPYAVSHPGDSPFEQPQHASGGGVAAQAVVLLGTIALSAPALWWGWLAVMSDVTYARLALWGGLAIGAGVLIVGLAIGSLIFRRVGTRLMEFAEST